MSTVQAVRIPKTSLIWLCQSPRFHKAVKLEVAAFVRDSIRSRALPGFEEEEIVHDITILSRLAGIEANTSTISPNDIVVPKLTIDSITGGLQFDALGDLAKKELLDFADTMIRYGAREQIST